MGTTNLFSKGLKASYLALASKNANTVYLCTDTRELYVGDTLYTEGVRLYTGELPNAPATGVLYFNEDTGVGSIYNGTAWKVVIKGTVTAIGTGASDTTLPTAKAVKDYVDAAISDVTGGAGIVTDIASKAGSNGTLTVTKGDGSKVDAPLTGVAHDATYDAANLVLTLPMVGGSPLVVNLPKDNFVTGGAYNSATKAIDLTLKDKSVVSIPAAALIDIYTSGSGAKDTVTIGVSADNKITATLKVATGGALGVDADGKLTVDLSAYATTASLTAKIGDVGSGSVKDYVDGKETALSTRIATNTNALTVLNGSEATAGSVAKSLKDAKTYADGLSAAMGARVTSVESAVAWGTF